MSPEHKCNYGELIKQMHNEICGTPEQPRGFRVRIMDLEAWKNASTKRVKSRWAWIYSILGGLTVGVTMGVINAFILHK